MTDSPFEYQILYFQKLQALQEALKDKDLSSLKTMEGFQQSMMRAGMQYWQNFVNNPERVFEAQSRYFDYLQNNEKPTNHNFDRYFKSDMWDSEPFFQWVKDIYIKTAEWMIETIEEEALGFSDEEKNRLRFLTRQMIEGMNPRNFPMMNPDVMKETMETKGDNLLRGMDNLIRDVQRGTISMTNEDAFKVGDNIATTAGNVIFKNNMMELIQYHPTTDKVYKEPLVIIPPWINKYYILDLTEQNSMIKWLVDQGHTVFCISWANPDVSFRNVGFKDYMHDGALKAIEIANTICDTDKANAVGYCIGGTLLAMAQAWLAGKGKPSPINSATYLTTLLDFEQAGELKVFIDRDQVEIMNKTLIDKGIMDGKAMSLSFSMLRASDLIWSFVINNYFMGKDPQAFDLLYWNSDSTNLPAAMHADYLESFYLDNKLAKGTYICDGVQLDLSKVNTPSYFLSTRDDHIAPWQACQAGTKLLGGDATFVLGGSGHVAGVVNPPHKNKYGYTVNDKNHDGSWWIHWQKWIKTLTKNKMIDTKNRKPHKNYKKISAAPGEYVLKKA
jgi:polyhydroxyalkanoate synthase